MSQPVILSESALKELKRVAEDQGMDLEKVFLRVGIQGGGCSGFMYDLRFDEEATEDDAKYDQGGIQVLVDKKSALYLDGTTLNFHEDLDKRGFMFDNPNAMKNCGCGKSFCG